MSVDVKESVRTVTIRTPDMPTVVFRPNGSDRVDIRIGEPSVLGGRQATVKLVELARAVGILTGGAAT